jgi:Ran GTPase-activating protein (RanGAP) involved in mRNA processing and transport
METGWLARGTGFINRGEVTVDIVEHPEHPWQDDADVQALAAAICASRTLATLRLDAVDLPAHKDVAAALCASPSLTSLQIMTAGRSRNAGKAAAVAAEMIVRGILTDVALPQSAVDDNGARAIARALSADTARLRSLNLAANNNIGPAGAAALGAALETNRTLTAIVLADLCGIGSPGALAFAKALAINATLKRLDLSNANIGTIAATNFFDALRENRTLVALDLSRNRIDDSAMGAAREALVAGCSPLARLALVDNEIGDAGARCFADALVVVHNNENETQTRRCALAHLDLRFNRIGPAGVQALGDALRVNTSLTHLALSSVDPAGIASDINIGVAALAAGLQANQTLTSLEYLPAHQLSAAATRCLFTAVETATAAATTALTSFSLTRSRFGGVSAALCGAALRVDLRQNKLTTLRLCANSIGPAGARQICDALVANAGGSLTHLDLAGNSLGDLGAAAIAAVLQAVVPHDAGRLAELNLEQNHIGPAGAAALGAALETNRTLTTLKCATNDICDAGAVAIAAGLGSNDTLTALVFGSSTVGEDGVRALAAALTRNTTVRSVRLVCSRTLAPGTRESLGPATAVRVPLTASQRLMFLRGHHHHNNQARARRCCIGRLPWDVTRRILTSYNVFQGERQSSHSTGTLIFRTVVMGIARKFLT